MVRGSTVAIAFSALFVTKAAALLRGNRTTVVTNTAQPDIPAGSLVFDFGFFDGTDSLSYLGQGFNVVAVEADPSLSDAARADPRFTAAMQSGQLKLLNVAIAPAGEQQWTTFYKNKCTKEWNSFYSGVGCRSCQPPHTEDPNSCDAVQVQATSCAQIVQQFGVPQYFKLDIEGAETGCYAAIKELPQVQRPKFISGEVGGPNLVAALHDIGYQSFKLVSQSAGTTGAWGSQAQDCRMGSLWRSFEGAKKELDDMDVKAMTPGDVCPGKGVGASWYDVHASTMPPQTA